MRLRFYESIAVAMFFSFVFGSLTHAETEQPIGNVICKPHGKYSVSTAPDEAGNGEIVKVVRLNKGESFSDSCARAEKAPLLKVVDGDSFFMQIENDLLFIDSGTSAGSRGLDIYDLKTQKKRFSGSYRLGHKLRFLPGNRVEFKSEERPYLGNCSKERLQSIASMGMSPASIRAVILDLTTFKLMKTSELLCEENE